MYPPLTPYRWGKTVYPPTLFPRCGERVNYTLFPLQYGGNLKVYLELHSFSPSVRWKSESVPYLKVYLFYHHNKMKKKSVLPTLFFPITEGEKVQRVKDYPYPSNHWCWLSSRVTLRLRLSTTRIRWLLLIVHCYIRLFWYHTAENFHEHKFLRTIN